VQQRPVACNNVSVYECDVASAQATSYSALIADNVRAARARIHITQASVARRMRALGYDWWYQQTAGAVERGERRLTTEEMLGLSVALDTTLAAIVLPVHQPGGQKILLPGGQQIVLVSGDETRFPGAAPDLWDGDEPKLGARGEEG
jgi:hypothetical protein